MRLGIRYQLLLPLVILMVGVIGMSTWTAVSSADAAGRHIEKQMEDIAKTAVKSASFLRNHQILHLMKGLSGEDFLLCEQLAAKEPTPDGGKTRPVLDDQQKPFTTLDVLPDDLPQPVEATTQDLGPRVHVGGKVYFCRGVKLKQEREKGRKGEGENWQSQPGLASMSSIRRLFATRPWSGPCGPPSSAAASAVCSPSSSRRRSRAE